MNSFIFFLSLLVIFENGSSTPAHPELRIVGGDVAEDSVPYQVSLRSDNDHFCGGSIISRRTVVTAAHCVVKKHPSSYVVVVGTSDIQHGGVYFKVERHKVHENYNPDVMLNDIALIVVEGSMRFSPKIQPIALFTGNIEINTFLTLTGWGLTSLPGNSPHLLQSLKLKAISIEYCKAIMQDISSSSHICTLNKRGQGSCFGDSGGPLELEGFLVGVVSWGEPCARGQPDIFTRVSTYANWIDSNMAE